MALALLNAADIVTTFVALHHGAHEANPVLSPSIHHWIVPIALKAGIVGAATWAALKIPAHKMHRAIAQYWCVVGVYAMVVVSNLLVIHAHAH